jgi:hypothetical protein
MDNENATKQDVTLYCDSQYLYTEQYYYKKHSCNMEVDDVGTVQHYSMWLSGKKTHS